MNVGDFLTGSNPFMGTTDYLGTRQLRRLPVDAEGLGAPSFSFVQSAVTVQATLLFSYSLANDSFDIPGFAGTQIGLYNVANPSQNELPCSHPERSTIRTIRMASSITT